MRNVMRRSREAVKGYPLTVDRIASQIVSRAMDGHLRALATIAPAVVAAQLPILATLVLMIPDGLVPVA